jgi:hypothetical protein
MVIGLVLDFFSLFWNDDTFDSTTSDDHNIELMVSLVQVSILCGNVSDEKEREGIIFYRTKRTVYR